MREDAVRRVNSTLQASFGKRYSVKLFGSTVYGTDHADSDLDMAFLVGHLSFFPEHNKLHLSDRTPRNLKDLSLGQQQLVQMVRSKVLPVSGY